MSLQTCMTFFVLWNTEEDIMKSFKDIKVVKTNVVYSDFEIWQKNLNDEQIKIQAFTCSQNGLSYIHMHYIKYGNTKLKHHDIWSHDLRESMRFDVSRHLRFEKSSYMFDTRVFIEKTKTIKNEA